MNLVTVFFGVAVVAACFIPNAYSLKCVTCSGINSCKDPKRYDCTSALASTTLTYLNYHYVNVSQTATTNYVCLADTFQDTTGEYSYSGCIYAEVQPCSLTLNSAHGEYYSRCCNQCRTDYCNPAGRASMSMIILAGMLIMTPIAKRLLY